MRTGGCRERHVVRTDSEGVQTVFAQHRLRQKWDLTVGLHEKPCGGAARRMQAAATRSL